MKQLRVLAGIIFLLLPASWVKAQYIVSLDTICLGNPLDLSTTVNNAGSYYWGFCSAYLNNIPTGSSILAGTGLNSPQSVALEKDSLFYVFAVNSGGSKNMIRYDFGTLASNSPVPNDLGNFGNLIPTNPRGLQLVKANGSWYGFLTGGSGAGDYHLVRFDFGDHLSNTPTVTDLGDLSGSITDPRDLYVFYENSRWNAVMFGGAGDLYHLDFGNVLTDTPSVASFGNFGSQVTGMWPMFDGSTWHLFYVKKNNQTLYRLDMGMALSLPVLPLTPNLVMGGATNAPFNGPRDVSIIKDCDSYYGYVTNENVGTLTVLNFGNSLTNVPSATNLGNFAGLNGAGYLTRFIRDKDNVFAFTANSNDNSISRLEYNSCVNSTMPNYYQQDPPPIYYNIPGTYNIYFAADEGLPTMKVDCQLLTVLPVPIIEINPDTLICQRDTILLVANGFNLASIVWDPVYNGFYNGNPPYDTTSIFVAPAEDFRYHVHLEFLKRGGCAYDTSTLVRVSKVTADAGLNRWVADGAVTTLGGPNLSYGQEFSYVWAPALFLDKSWVANPICRPKEVQPYYLTVTNDSTGCSHKDTVWVYTECTQINMPNVFNPQSDIHINRTFGLLNTRVVKLEYFKIFNRWGNLIFETTDFTKAWDGTQNNIELPSDNYVWMIDGYCDNGKRVRKEGTVLLVR